MAAIQEFILSNYCALTSPFTFLTGDHLDKSDLIRSRFGFHLPRDPGMRVIIMLLKYLRLFIAVFLGNRILFHSRSCYGCDAVIGMEMASWIFVLTTSTVCCYELCK